MASVIAAGLTSGTALAMAGDTSGALQLQTNGTTTAVTIDTSQNVGIGTSSPDYQLQLEKTAASNFVSIVSGTANTAGLLLGDTDSATIGRIEYDNSSNFMALYANSAERMRIDSSGSLLVGTTVASQSSGVGIKSLYSATDPAVSVVAAGSTNSTNGLLIYSTGAAAYRFYVGLGGTIYATSIVITAISDQRLKENVRDIDTGLNAIMSLKPRRFDWKEGKGQDKKNVAGFIAQEFEEVFPECVSASLAGEDGIEYKNINHETLIPTLVKAIQEQQALIIQLQADVAALKGVKA